MNAERKQRSRRWFERKNSGLKEKNNNGGLLKNKGGAQDPRGGKKLLLWKKRARREKEPRLHEHYGRRREFKGTKSPTEGNEVASSTE